MDDTEQLQEKQRQIMVLLGETNDLDLTISRFRNELNEMYLENDRRLDKENENEGNNQCN